MQASKNMLSEVPLIKMEGVAKHFSNSGAVIKAIDNIDLSITEGEYVSVVGRSGSGKSTLMNMITGIDHPSSGEVIIGNVNTGKLTENEMAAWRCRNLGIVFQFYQLIPVLSIFENVLLPMQLLEDSLSENHNDRVKNLLDVVDLWGKKDRFPAQLSGGEQQRAAVARALVNDPAILIADEPTGNLGSTEAENVMDVFKKAVNAGRTVIFVTHDLELAARAKRTITLSDGQIIKDENRSTRSRSKRGRRTNEK